MHKLYRRYEVLLPLRFNDGRDVPDELISDAVRELEQHFGAVSCETQYIRGQWSHQGQNYRDELVRVFVDVPDTADHRQFFIDFKERLKSRIQQIDIWVTTHPLEIL